MKNYVQEAPAKRDSLLCRVKNRVLMEAYLLGYTGVPVRRLTRKMLAKTEIHRAWLLGKSGCFEEDGIKYGPANPYCYEKHRELLAARSCADGEMVSQLGCDVEVPV